jgi:hypothetical protein
MYTEHQTERIFKLSSKASGLTFTLLAIILIGLIPATILWGFALKTCWGYFIVPLGVAAIGKAQALGIASFISAITHQDLTDLAKKEGRDDADALLIKGFLLQWLKPIFVIVIAAIYKAYM